MREALLVLALLAVEDATRREKHETPNFEVEAPTAAIARQVGENAERYRKEVALRWLGKQLPDWKERCPIRIKLTARGDGASSSFEFNDGKIVRQSMELEGKLEAIQTSTLRHEITHMILAHHFSCPIPRWADEGAAVLAEGPAERRRHMKMAREILAKQNRAIPLKRLFVLKEYPDDVMVLYAEGFAVTRFLVEAKDRKTFLAFVADGMKHGWDGAAKAHYGYADVAALEAAWLKWLGGDSVEPD